MIMLNFLCLLALGHYKGVPSVESSRSVRGLGKGVSGKHYPRYIYILKFVNHLCTSILARRILEAISWQYLPLVGNEPYLQNIIDYYTINCSDGTFLEHVVPTYFE